MGLFLLAVRRLAVRAGVIIALGAGLFTGSPLLAGDLEHEDVYELMLDQDRARQALVRGEIAPLEKILAAARSEVDGDFVGAELEIEYGIWVYDIKFIDRRGVLRKIHVDAKTARIIERDAHK